MRYCAYELDEGDGIHSRVELKAECEADARLAARALRFGFTLEVWEISTTAAWDRLVCRLVGRRGARRRWSAEARDGANGKAAPREPQELSAPQ